MNYSLPTNIENRPIAILGAGTLGRRIAMTYATRVGVVRLYDISERPLDDAKKFIDQQLPALLKSRPGSQPATLEYITDLPSAIKNAWYIVEIAAQRAIKRVFDPTGLLNPGIMLPDESPDEPRVTSFEAALCTALQGHTTTAATTGGGTQIAVNTANLSLAVGASVTLDELSRHLAEHGVSCAAIPAEATQRTVGELIANPSAAERQAVRHALLGLDVVLPDGQAAARFGGENMKDVAGYDTKRLFIGGRGAFGAIITAIFKITVNAA